MQQGFFFKPKRNCHERNPRWFDTVTLPIQILPLMASRLVFLTRNLAGFIEPAHRVSTHDDILVFMSAKTSCKLLYAGDDDCYYYYYEGRVGSCSRTNFNWL